jgi:hypothetical protein
MLRLCRSGCGLKGNGVVKARWIVELVKVPVVNDFRSDYFPRECYYRADALKLVAEVARKGGEARITSTFAGMRKVKKL